MVQCVINVIRTVKLVKGLLLIAPVVLKTLFLFKTQPVKQLVKIINLLIAGLFVKTVILTVLLALFQQKIVEHVKRDFIKKTDIVLSRVVRDTK